MNSEFSRIITLLRKEKGMSQKSVAQQLGVSQALLSHYEKGIRECGLAFVVKTADFYGVSCDYLLGRSPERQGTTISTEELRDPSEQSDKPNPRTLKAVYNKKLIFCSLNILFDLLANVGSTKLLDEVSKFLSFSVYRMFRVIFRVQGTNNDEMFMIPDVVSNSYAQSEMLVSETNANTIASGKLPRVMEPPKFPENAKINNEILEKAYPQDKSALLNLIKNCEDVMADK